MLKEAIRKVIEGRNLTEQESMDAMDEIMEGRATPAQIGSFITALRIKGETIEEITGCARVMRQKAARIKPEADYVIDTCGTGGDGSNTINISTAAALVCAAGGVVVAKHGNRSVSSQSGSADVLEALGVEISLSPEQVKLCMDKTGIGFLFAPGFHQSMRHAAGPRKELGFRTIFNVLGPLTNPAGAKGQLMGVFDGSLTEPIAHVLLKLGVERALVVHGADGMDEITVCDETKVSEVRNGQVISYSIEPGAFGLQRAGRHEVQGGTAFENAEMLQSILKGAGGAQRDAVVLNSAAALYVGRVVDSLKLGVERAQEIIDSGRAMEKLEELRFFTQRLHGQTGQESRITLLTKSCV